MDETGRGDIAVILRLKRSAALRKESMMVLAREWGYKGSIWQRGLSSVGVTTPVLRPHRGDWDDVAPAGKVMGLGQGAARQPQATQLPRTQKQQQQQHSGENGRAVRGEGVAVKRQQNGMAGGLPFLTVEGPPPPQLPATVDPMASATAAVVTAAFQAHMAAAAQQQQQRQQQQAALYQHLAAASQQAAWFASGGGAYSSPAGFDAQQLMQQQQQAAGVQEVARLCDTMRQAGRDTAVVWEKVVARASEQQLRQQREQHRAGDGACTTLCCQAERDPATGAVADALSHNAIACAVAHWLRGVASAHGASLAEEQVRQGGGGGSLGGGLASSIVLMRQATDLVASRQAALEACRSTVCAHLATQGLTGVSMAPGAAMQPGGPASGDGAVAAASPPAAEVEPSLQWLRCCARLLDDVLNWLAHAKSFAASQFGTSSLVCSSLVARLSEAFFSAAEETLELRRQWLALSLMELQRSRGAEASHAGDGSHMHKHAHEGGAASRDEALGAPEFEAETCFAVVHAVLQTFARGALGQETAAAAAAAAAAEGVAASHDGGAEAHAA